MKLVFVIAVIAALLQFLAAGLCIQGALEHWPCWLLLMPMFVGLSACAAMSVRLLVRLD